MRTSSSVPFVELGTYRMQVTKEAIGGFQVDRLTASFNPRAADPRAASAEAVARSHLGLGNARALQGPALGTFKLKAGQSRAASRLLAFKLPAVCWRHGPQVSVCAPSGPHRTVAGPGTFAQSIQVAPFFLSVSVTAQAGSSSSVLAGPEWSA